MSYIKNQFFWRVKLPKICKKGSRLGAQFISCEDGAKLEGLPLTANGLFGMFCMDETYDANKQEPPSGASPRSPTLHYDLVGRTHERPNRCTAHGSQLGLQPQATVKRSALREQQLVKGKVLWSCGVSQGQTEALSDPFTRGQSLGHEEQVRRDSTLTRGDNASDSDPGPFLVRPLSIGVE